ncbi:MAG: hypothetical protein ABI690_24145 [Chloroflexota bacterium]
MGYMIRAISLLALGWIMAACSGAAGPAAALPLTQSFKSGDGTISLNYPDKWVTQDLLGQVSIGNSQSALDAATPAPGQFQARLFGTPVSAIQGLKADATPNDVLGFFAESLSTSGVTFNKSTELTVGSHPAARIEGSGTDGQAIVIAVDLGGGNYIFATATSAPGEIPGFEPTLLAILESLTYTPLTAPVPESTP